MTQIITKPLKNIDSVYDFDAVQPHFYDEDVITPSKGFDCIYRAIHVQSKFPELDLQFGCPWFLGQAPDDETILSGRYYLAYTWHAWCEDEHNVLDSIDCLTAVGHNVDPDSTVMIIPVPKSFYLPRTYFRGSNAAKLKYIDTTNAFIKWMKDRVANISKTANPPQIILFDGLALDNPEVMQVYKDGSIHNHVIHPIMGWDEFNYKADEAIIKHPGIVASDSLSLDDFYAATGPAK